MRRIESSKNPKVKQWKKLHTRKERERAGLFLVEGFHMVEEALHTNGTVSELIINEKIEIPSKWDMTNIDVTYVNDEIIAVISETEAPQGIFAVCNKLTFESSLDNKNKYLLVDAVQDPGNVGTMIRTAEAVGIDAIILGNGTVDLYNPKVLRATQGAIFRVPIVKGSLVDWVRILKEKHVSVFGTSLQNGVDYREITPQSKYALLVGNEGNGVNEELLKRTTSNIYIPIYGESESLNVAVATGILLYHFQQ
ncbi:TrmH family RNA methyltransferase [Cytobacillus sp. Hm23]